MDYHKGSKYLEFNHQVLKENIPYIPEVTELKSYRNIF